MAATPSFWKQRSGKALLLWPVSQLYRALTALRRALYRHGILKSTRIAVPVIVVGNVIAGGAGKTPVTIAVAKHLLARGWKPGIISRGYGRHTTDCRAVDAATSSAQDVGDEPLMLARSTGVPVWVANQRVQAAHALLARHPEVNVLICDDGLQHLALQRDVEICVFNDDGIGNGWLLPAGPLREPWPRAAAHDVDLVLYAGQSPGGRAPRFQLKRRLADDAVDAIGRHVALNDLRGQALHAVAAIARPDDFFSMLRARDLQLRVAEALPDHYDFNDWKRDASSPNAALPLICTEKDATKLWTLEPHALAAKLEVEIPPDFFNALDALLRQ